MNHLIIYAHPHPESLNHAILDTAVHALKKNGHEVIVRDLYALHFQPVLTPEDISVMNAGDIPQDIKTEQEYITRADVITFIYPIWWTGLPAILKGYIDRVFSYGFAYEIGENGEVIRMLTGKKGLIINTFGHPKENYDEIGMTNGLKITSDTGIFEFVGVEPTDHLLFGSVGSLNEEAYKGMLKEVEERVHSIFPASI
ncbi:NAD(P)H-dependent oxidoreductase [Halalkalibacterium halodurans]|uniref:NAD(P)H oxidoreductase n=1 Tax=Halalkalibacterium halodurans (strain ATCC BAA-125 / DSM 18197 / FERM 7344 / JCM 9153 / C-125) TaxID=272558 RepID=Q9K9A1_HALH5|nr:NAD(P)H-dependent oxidoreductase [Halalkalibacterium halodurans]MDY7223299.1 NAD(P)H-dependent oxidoreductase [Halalkalibacterium halodurans]MDY7242520.1 NAD(P)H-dependent oxidoreductase [Halalkalibacterium halodurans]MED4172327.1 NAD(P)H-dependent oxidoreductase [Halalkalibacterium halodurans]BAB06467.1 NAD(P)H oxidoreductase [Halalkalibacterium halodurans C-125]